MNFPKMCPFDPKPFDPKAFTQYPGYDHPEHEDDYECFKSPKPCECCKPPKCEYKQPHCEYKHPKCCDCCECCEYKAPKCCDCCECCEYKAPKCCDCCECCECKPPKCCDCCECKCPKCCDCCECKPPKCCDCCECKPSKCCDCCECKCPKCYKCCKCCKCAPKPCPKPCHKPFPKPFPKPCPKPCQPERASAQFASTLTSQVIMTPDFTPVNFNTTIAADGECIKLINDTTVQLKPGRYSISYHATIINKDDDFDTFNIRLRLDGTNLDYTRSAVRLDDPKTEFIGSLSKTNLLEICKTSCLQLVLNVTDPGPFTPDANYLVRDSSIVIEKIC